MKKIVSVLALAALFAIQPVMGQNTPEEALKLYKTAIEKGLAVELLDLLPPSYVKDATGLVNEFGGRMDPEVWTKLRDTVTKAATVLASKAELLVGMAGEDAEMPEAAKAARVKAVREAIAAVGSLAKSDLMELDRLKTMDAKTFAKEISTAFAATTAASKAMEAEASSKTAEMFKVLKSETLPSGNVAITFAGEDGAEGDTEEFKQVEGRWVPAEMADEWTGSISGARDGLAKLDFTTPEGQQQKAQFLMMMQMLDPMIQQIGQAQSAEQLQQMMGGMFMPLMMMGGGMGRDMGGDAE